MVVVVVVVVVGSFLRLHQEVLFVMFHFNQLLESSRHAIKLKKSIASLKEQDQTLVNKDPNESKLGQPTLYTCQMNLVTLFSNKQLLDEVL